MKEIKTEASQGGTMPSSDANESMPRELADKSGTDNGAHHDVYIEIFDCITKNKAGASGINHDLTARWVLQSNYVVHLIETGNTLIYREGVYEDFAEEHLKKVLFDAFERFKKFDGRSLINTHDINEVMARIRTWRLKSISEFKCDQHVFNMANGILDLDTFELMPHSPKWMLMSKSPVKFDPDMECTAFSEFLDQALEQKYHPLLKNLLDMFCGLCI